MNFKILEWVILPSLLLVSLVSALKISGGESHICAWVTLSKCWGRGTFGQLGFPTTDSIGMEDYQMGEHLLPIDFGAGKVAMDIVIGEAHTCAKLNDATVKCCGESSEGQLGAELTQAIGSRANEMGDNLAPVDLGGNRTVRHIASESRHTCAILDDHTVKCWGGGGLGQLGQESPANIGASANEMGDTLPTIDFGTGDDGALKVEHIACGRFHNCVVLQHSSSAKCWGLGNDGQLGLETIVQHGSAANEMGDYLPTIDLGEGKTAQQFMLGSFHTCVLLSGGSVKCWGRGLQGQLGTGAAEHIGRTTGEMGDYLPEVDLGAGKSAVHIAAGGYHNCALLNDNSVKCWGRGDDGQLGQENREHVGDSDNEMGDFLPPVELGFQMAALQITCGSTFSCAVLHDYTLKCWGAGRHGQLGLGVVRSVGTDSHEMGDYLSPISLGSMTTYHGNYMAHSTHSMTTPASAIVSVTSTTSIASTSAIVTASVSAMSTALLKAQLGLFISDAHSFVEEPNVEVVLRQPLADLASVSVNWVHSIDVSLKSSRRLSPGAKQHKNFRQISEIPDSVNVLIQWAIELPPEENSTAPFVISEFSAKSITEMSTIMNNVIGNMLRKPYEATVTWKHIVDSVTEESDSQAGPAVADKSDDKSGYGLWHYVFAAFGGALLCGFLLLGHCLCRETYRRRNKAAKTKEEFMRIAGPYASYDFHKLLNPPEAISSTQGENIRKLARAMLDYESHAAPVFLTYAIGQRPADAEKCGPGMYFAAAVLKMLYDNGIKCFCDLMIPVGVPREIFLDQIGSEFDICKVLLVLETKAMFQSSDALAEIYAAQNESLGIQIIPLRFDSDLPPQEEQWTGILRSDVEGMLKLSSVLNIFGRLNSLPSPPYTVIDQPSVLNDLLVDLQLKLRPTDEMCKEGTDPLVMYSRSVGRTSSDDSTKSLVASPSSVSKDQSTGDEGSKATLPLSLPSEGVTCRRSSTQSTTLVAVKSEGTPKSTTLICASLSSTWDKAVSCPIETSREPTTPKSRKKKSIRYTDHGEQDKKEPRSPGSRREDRSRRSKGASYGSRHSTHTKGDLHSLPSIDSFSPGSRSSRARSQEKAKRKSSRHTNLL